MAENADIISLFTMEKCLTADEAIAESKQANMTDVVIVGWREDHSLFIRSGGNGKILTRADTIYLMELAKLHSLGVVD